MTSLLYTLLISFVNKDHRWYTFEGYDSAHDDLLRQHDFMSVVRCDCLFRDVLFQTYYAHSLNIAATCFHVHS
jgi:hypothetical protein